MVTADPGSFRDPASGVLLGPNQVYRFFTSGHVADFEALVETGLLDSLVASGAVIETKALDIDEAPEPYRAVPGTGLVVEHPRVPFISYAYEWPFEMLKAAAIRSLEILQLALQKDLILKDATPYNVQFIGTNPLLIDVGSFERYQKGAPWMGYTQFCRTFLNPLLLQSITGIPFQMWMRSSLEGIDPVHLNSILPLRHKLRKNVFMDVVLQAWLSRRYSSGNKTAPSLQGRAIPKGVITGLVNRLKKSVTGLKRRAKARSPWLNYEEQCHYEPEALEHKDRFVGAALAQAKPEVVWDLGCNVGRYSITASRHAGYVVAIDSDEAAVGALYERIKDQHTNILPLVLDFLNPSPSQGWAQEERRGLGDRGAANFVLCLALVHHLAIGGNVPLNRIVEWLSTFAEAGVVEFVPKSDPMVQALLRTRQDVFGGYTQAAFEEALRERFKIIEAPALPRSERVLYRFAAGSASA
ncbi:MAG: class I SAM-dependent methyltransferase [Chloroflexi bacterium]|nr:class I SAM-dependent methyltransferase [Chloroflexota bacterium]